MEMQTSYLLNPGRKTRKARRSKRHGRLRKGSAAAKAWGRKMRALRGGRVSRRKSHRKSSRRSSRRAKYVYTHPSKKTRNRLALGRRVNRRGWFKKSKRGGVRRRINNGVAALLGGSSADVISVPFLKNLPLPGFLKAIPNTIVQSLAAGGLIIGGYFLSGYAVDILVTVRDAEAAPADSFKRSWARPLLFGAVAGVVGGVVAMVAPAGKKATWSLLAAAGPGLRALGGFLKAIMKPPTEQGFANDVYRFAAGMADYLQVGDLYEAGMGDGSASQVGDGEYNDSMDNASMEDYLQVGDLYEAGMGQNGEPEDVFAST